MKVYFSNLPANVNSYDLWEFIDISLDSSVDPYAQNTIFIDGNIGFSDIRLRRGHEIHEDEIIKQLNSRPFNECIITAKISNTSELGLYVASKISSLRSKEN